MYIVVTGAAGFIGANLVRGLNARGETDIIAVDNLDARRQVPQPRRLRDRRLPRQGRVPRAPRATATSTTTSRAVLHQGACSDTMETDGRYMMRNNYRYSVRAARPLPEQRHPVPLRVERVGVRRRARTFVEKREHEAPLNVYGYSKFLFDQHVRRVLPERTAPIVGFRYFNVYGPREQHKGRMASVACHFFHQYRERRPRAAVRRLRRLRRRRAAARLRVGRRRRARSTSTSSIIRSAPASSTSAPGARRRSTTWRWPRSTRAARPTGEAPLSLAELVRARRDRVHRRFRRARGQVPELHAGGPDARCARRATRRR